MSVMIETMGSMTEITRDDMMSCLSDLYKDVYGFRPREYFWNRVRDMTVDELGAEADRLQKELEEQLVIERQGAIAAQKRFEENILTIIGAGAGDRQTALRWMVQAEGDPTCEQDVEHLLYMGGLDFSIMPQYMEEMGFVRKGMVWIFKGVN